MVTQIWIMLRWSFTNSILDCNRGFLFCSLKQGDDILIFSLSYVDSLKFKMGFYVITLQWRNTSPSRSCLFWSSPRRHISQWSRWERKLSWSAKRNPKGWNIVDHHQIYPLLKNFIGRLSNSLLPEKTHCGHSSHGL